ncbi:MAG: hypothetical protein JSW34_04465 [Candidatus Zixiibacteriota bacterium]|nr:MAG: hypothetical protein JSW34_04465 [candidate division Zixibacteria bacterium]
MKNSESNIAVIVIVTATIILCSSNAGVAQESAGHPETTITFVTSALERILYNPELVLEEEETFWVDEKVQVLAQSWIDEVGVRNARNKWRKKVRKLAELPHEEREGHQYRQMTDYIKTHERKFLDSAVPHLLSYVPETGKSLSRPIYFTAFIPPRAFANSEGIVIDVASRYWRGNPDNILNCLVHEFFHVCYSWFRADRTEQPVGHEFLYKMMEYLQNEGLATYVGHNALPIFPAPDEKDYQLLESPAEVTRLLKELNVLFDAVGTVSSEELRKANWDTGIEGRAYYIVGAHMAGVIEDSLGREALHQTLKQGPRSFIESYNTLVQEDMTIRYPDEGTIHEREEAMHPSGGVGSRQSSTLPRFPHRINGEWTFASITMSPVHMNYRE